MKDFRRTIRTDKGWITEVDCPINKKTIIYSKSNCEDCDFYHLYCVCTYRPDAPICPLDGRRCNSSAGLSSILDCRHDFGFELRPPRCDPAYNTWFDKTLGNIEFRNLKCSNCEEFKPTIAVCKDCFEIFQALKEKWKDQK